MAKHWYVVHTYSGYENKVKVDLEHRIETYGMTRQIVDVQIPTEEVTELKEGGKPETKESKVFPGYVWVRMELTDDTSAVVRNTPGVTGFVGIGNNPSPLSRDDYKRIMGRTKAGRASAGSEAPRRTNTTLEVGQAIRVINGPLADFDGQISELMPDSGKVKVMLTIFGRDTPVELSLDQIATIV
jgi:transcriptional antiterminator NusG